MAACDQIGRHHLLLTKKYALRVVASPESGSGQTSLCFGEA